MCDCRRLRTPPLPLSQASRIQTAVALKSPSAPALPVAALEIFKNFGTNGGGFFNANGAHPQENPSPLSNLLELRSIVLIPATLTNTFYRMVQQLRQGWMLYSVMVVLFCGGLITLHLATKNLSIVFNGASAVAQVGLNGMSLGFVFDTRAARSYLYPPIIETAPDWARTARINLQAASRVVGQRR